MKKLDYSEAIPPTAYASLRGGGILAQCVENIGRE